MGVSTFPRTDHARAHAGGARPLGVTQALLADAGITPRANLHLGSRIIPMQLADLAMPNTAFPHLTLIRQADAERVLAQTLADRGVEVERGTELAEVRDGPEGVRALLRSPARAEKAVFCFAAGCDGPASVVRTQAGIGWPGRPYAVEVVLAGDRSGDERRHPGRCEPRLEAGLRNSTAW